MLFFNANAQENARKVQGYVIHREALDLLKPHKEIVINCTRARAL